MNEQEQFLKDLDQKEGNSVLDQVLEPEKVTVEGEEKPEEDEMKLRNRREKRLAQRLQEEREAGIALAERVKVLTETQKFKEEAGDDHLKSIEKIYGTDTPESVAATEILKSALRGVGEKATERALEKLREEHKIASQAVAKEEKELDSMIDEIEDENTISLSEPQRKLFFSTLEKMSPKDKDGNVIAYADHHAVWEIVQAKSVKTENRAKDLSSRSMVQSGSSKESKLDEDSTARYLRDNGII